MTTPPIPPRAKIRAVTMSDTLWGAITRAGRLEGLSAAAWLRRVALKELRAVDAAAPFDELRATEEQAYRAMVDARVNALGEEIVKERAEAYRAAKRARERAGGAGPKDLGVE